jgi:hypothetical protein
MAIIVAMWNHAPRMEKEGRKLGILWPRFRPGDTADLAAFLLTRGAPRPRGADLRPEPRAWPGPPHP